MGYNQDRLAHFFLQRQGQILEMIHRSSTRDYAYTRGVNKGSFNEVLMNQHRNHLHIAMAAGGVIGEPVLGFGASGHTYSFAENGPERVMPMWQSGGGGNTYVTVHAGYVVMPQELENRIAYTINRLQAKGRV